MAYHLFHLLRGLCLTLLLTVFVESVTNAKLQGISPKVQLLSLETDDNQKTLPYTIIQEDGSVRVETRKHLSVVKKIKFACISTFPTKWIFECPASISNPHYKITKKVKWNSELSNFEYSSNLTMNIAKSLDIINIEETGLTNVTCSQVSNNVGTIAEILQSQNATILIREAMKMNVINSKCKEKSFNKSPSCTERVYADLKTATYACYKSDKQISIEVEPIFSCFEKEDFCASLIAAYNETSVGCTHFSNFTRGRRYNKTIEPSIHPGIIQVQCEKADNPILVSYYAIDDKSTGDKFYKTKQDTLQIPDVLDLRPNLTTAYDGQIVGFECKGFSSVFALGSLFSHLTSSGNEFHFKDKGMHLIYLFILEDLFFYLILSKMKEAYSPSGHIIAKISFQVYRNMTGTKLSCKMPIVNSESWEIRTFNFTKDFVILSSQLPKIFEVKLIQSMDNGTLLKCNATGYPIPIIRWFRARTIKNKTAEIYSKNSRMKSLDNEIFIKNLTFEDIVICRAENVVGSDELAFQIQKDNDNTIVIIICVASIIIICLIAGVILAYFHRRKQSEFSKQECKEFYSGGKLLNQEDPLSGALLLSYDLRFEIPRKEIKIEERVLGSGQFGIVTQGKYKDKIVAVKTIRPTTDIAYFKALLYELKILQYVGNHPNIVNLLGACTANIRKMEVLLVLEFCENGNLVTYLRLGRKFFKDSYHHIDEDISKQPLYENNSVKTLTSKDLVRFSLEIAKAMTFIAEKEILHGDLAGRNVLVTEDKHAKLCDFGLSKQLHQYSVYVQKQECPLPLRWMAIESLQDMEFSIESDVWSFGVTLWEIFTLSEIPYSGSQWGFDSWRLLKDGHRLEHPQFANVSLYQLMQACWKSDPAERPKFSYLAKALQTELDLLREL